MLTKKKINKFKIQIRSRHNTHAILREPGALPLLPFKSVVRLGSITPYDDNRVEINSVDSVRLSSNKGLMKQCFTRDEVKTADWWCINQAKIGKQFTFCNFDNDDRDCTLEELPYPIVAKHIYGSRGLGNYKLDTKEELEAFLLKRANDLEKFIFEKFYNYNCEYRLHVTKDGFFYTCRKLLKADTPQENRWFRNDSNCNWILKENPSFNKPNNWDDIVNESVKALLSVGLDIGAVDVKVQSSKKGKENPKFIIIEINSAPSFGEITFLKYKEQIERLLIEKNNK
jgi:carbamoylphosphate synthase large subunit